VAFTAVATIALIGAAAALLTGEPKVSLVRTGHPRSPLASPSGASGTVLHTSVGAPIEWVLLVLAIIALAFAAWLWAGWGRSHPPGAPA
jgi:hypothetical protein